jgi:hypothetical protein
MAQKKVSVYEPLPSITGFHACDSPNRALVGPVGSGKSTAASMEVGLLLPRHIANTYGVTETRWAIVRNTYRELVDSTLVTFKELFPFGEWHEGDMIMNLRYPPSRGCNFPLDVEVLFRSCNRPGDMKKFKSVELTGAWVEESIEVHEEIKKMLRNRIGRYPRKSPVRFFIETTNPPDVEHPVYWQYNWVPIGQDPANCPVDMTGRMVPWAVPGPRPKRKPLPTFFGWWAPPHENDKNLRPGYYDDLLVDYGNDPEWIKMYIEGRPGLRVLGRVVYGNFNESRHVSREFLESNGTPLYMGWDNSGNFPAAILAQIRGPLSVQILAEFYSEREGIVDFTKKVLQMIEEQFPGHMIAAHYGDPAGGARYATAKGGLTSNANLMFEECGVMVIPSEQAITARVQSVDQMLARIEGVIIDPRCTRLINGFSGGYVYPEKLGSPGEYLKEPMKNSYAHLQDATQYLFAKLFAVKKRLEQELQLRQVFTLDDIRKQLQERDKDEYDDEKRW